MNVHYDYDPYRMATSRHTPVVPVTKGDPEVVVEVDRGTSRPARRRGRPPESDGLTEERILEAARACFAESGYAGTSTHAVAARAGLTTGALYHYFGAKRDLYVAVFRQVEEAVVTRLRAAAAAKATFREKMGAILDEIVRLNRADSTMARFMQSVMADVSRHADLLELFKNTWPRRDEFLLEIVDLGVATGELAARDRRMIVETITTMMVGIVGVSDLVPGAQARAVEGYKRLMDGLLLQKGLPE